MSNSFFEQTLAHDERASIAFHVARDPEFLEGVQDGRQLFPDEWDLTGRQGWWDVDDVLRFVQKELSPTQQVRENHLRAIGGVPPRTSIYHLGLVAGYLSRFVEAARAGEEARSC